MSGGVAPDGVGPGDVVPADAETSPVARSTEPVRRVNAGVLLKTRPVASTTCFGLHRRPTGAPDEPILLMSVPRRVLKRAVDRNTVRRLARESLRATREQAYGCALMLRLKRTPTGFEALTQRARKAAWRAELERVFSLGVGRA
ncbi:MAG: ribonuclease P protein component [Betaproteobacteria bacterium]|nr:ribonuclease P protein component [Betaproteobacteria bacterium]